MPGVLIVLSYCSVISLLSLAIKPRDRNSGRSQPSMIYLISLGTSLLLHRPVFCSLRPSGALRLILRLLSRKYSLQHGLACISVMIKTNCNNLSGAYQLMMMIEIQSLRWSLSFWGLLFPLLFSFTFRDRLVF